MKHIRPENKNTAAILCMNGKSGANKKIKNDKTLNCLQQEAYWVGMASDVE